MAVAVVESIKAIVTVKVSDGSHLTYEATFKYKNAERDVAKFIGKTLARFGRDSK